MGTSRFAAVMRADAEPAMLDEAAYAISATFHSGLDEIGFLAAIDIIAGECPTPTPRGIADHLFGTLGFEGDRTNYNDWRNSCLDLVIERRRGIPITLSVLMLEVGRRLGVRLVGVGMPAHFLVGVAGDEDAFFDPFNGGRQLDRAGVRELFTTITNGQTWSESFLAPTPNRSIVIRMLNNLMAIFSQRRDAIRLAQVMQLRAAVPELAETESAAIQAAVSIFN
jgi:regulator of sirC expression with transglutaminase-like and TPR domain